jgi:putative adenylate-forming enzyme
MGEQAFWAGAVLAKVLRTSLLAPHRIALFLRANNQLYHAVANYRIRLNFFDLGDSFEELLRNLADFQPTVLVGPPRLLVRIAHLIAEASYPIRPQQVVSAAEVLDLGDRELIQSAFGVPVDEVYQATEGFLAATCRFGRLHWNEDIVLIEREPIGHGRFIPIITDFRRRTQPIIRYRLDDVIIESDRICPCGSIFRPIGKIEGRADDLLKLLSIDNQGGTGLLFPDFVRLAVATASPYLQDFKVTQTRLDRIEIALLPELPTEASRAEFLTHFENTLAKICEPNGLVLPECVLTPWRAEPPTQKQRRVRSLVN